MSSTPESQPPESPLRSSTPLATSDSGSAPATPSKTDGWMHFQIKKEPTSPAPQLIPAASPRSVYVKSESGAGGRDSPVHRRTIGAGSRIGRVSPMTSVSGASDTSRLPSPVTPTKDWTHVQIKSEPTSPVPMPGWQNLSSLMSPTKPPSLGALSPPPAKSASPLLKAVSGASGGLLSPPLPVMEKPSPVRPVTMNIGSIGSKMAASPVLTTSTVTAAIAPITKQSTQVATIASPSVTVTTRPPRPSVPQVARPGGMLIIQPPLPASTASRPSTPALPAPRPGQATVFVKCMDNQGKIYLIPQHLLTKTTGGVTPAPTTPLRLPTVTLPTTTPTPAVLPASSPLVMQTSPGSSLLRGLSPAGQTIILQRPTDPSQKSPAQPVVLQLPGAAGLQITSPVTTRKPRPSTPSVTPQVGEAIIGRSLPTPQTSPRIPTTQSPSLLLTSPNPTIPRSPAGGLAQLAAAASLLEATPVAKTTSPSTKPSESLVVLGDLSRSTPTPTPKPAEMVVLAGGLRPTTPTLRPSAPTTPVAKPRENVVVFGPRVATATVGTGKTENMVVLGTPSGGTVRLPAGE